MIVGLVTIWASLGLFVEILLCSDLKSSVLTLDSARELLVILVAGEQDVHYSEQFYQLLGKNTKHFPLVG